MRILFLLLVWLIPAFVAAKTATPCVVKKNGRWRVVRDKSCVQFSRADMVTYNKQLLRLRYYLKKYEPACESQKKNYKRLDFVWKRSDAVWKEQKKTYTQLIKVHMDQGKVWRDAFFKLKKQKVPQPHWTKSPVLWVSVGIVVGVATTVAVTVAVQSASHSSP